MSIRRYIFRKESERELQDFFKTVEECPNTCCISTERKQLLERIFPLDPAVEKRFKTATPEEITDLPTSILPNSDTIDSTPELDQESLIATQNLSEFIQDQLESEGSLSADFMNELASYPSTHIQTLFINLHENLNIRQIQQLGITLKGNITLMKYFHQELLIKQMCLKENQIVTKLINEYLLLLGNSAVEMITNIIININMPLNYLETNLGNLDLKQKNIILNSFVTKCNQLHLTHISLLEKLLTPQIEEGSVVELGKLLANMDKNDLKEKKLGTFLLLFCKNSNKKLQLIREYVERILISHQSMVNVEIKKMFN